MFLLKLFMQKTFGKYFKQNTSKICLRILIEYFNLKGIKEICFKKITKYLLLKATVVLFLDVFYLIKTIPYLVVYIFLQ